MSAAQCRNCLGGLVASMPGFLDGKPGGRSLGIWCNLRYSVRPFFTDRAMLHLPAPAPAPAPRVVPSIDSPETGGGRKRGAAVGISAGVACAVVLILIFSAVAVIRYKRKIATKNDLSSATPLEKMARANKLCWDQQYNIIVGIAKGILYFHEDSRIRIIHRDLKASNILLDEYADPKIADFGLARLLGDHTQTKTATVAGTYGYMAPEYAMHGRVSPKVDIFSFGVLVLETVTRRRNTGFDNCDTVNVLSDVWNCWTTGMISQMMDQTLEGYS